MGGKSIRPMERGDGRLVFCTITVESLHDSLVNEVVFMDTISAFLASDQSRDSPSSSGLHHSFV